MERSLAVQAGCVGLRGPSWGRRRKERHRTGSDSVVPYGGVGRQAEGVVAEAF